MTVTMHQPAVDEMRMVLAALRDWQTEDAPLQLHPGDIGWFWRFGAAATAAATRVWTRDGQIVAVGLLDGPTLLRLAIEPSSLRYEELARRIAHDTAGMASAAQGGGLTDVESPPGSSVHERLSQDGWTWGEARTPLRMSLTAPVSAPGVRIEVVEPALAAVRVAIQRASFTRSTFTRERWLTMAAGPAYAEARCLVAYDGHGVGVAAVTVWSAGPDRPGLIEPLGVHGEHRRRGYGTAITLAAAAALREMGSSSAVVCPASANLAAVEMYRAAGLRALAERRDHHR